MTRKIMAILVVLAVALAGPLACKSPEDSKPAQTEPADQSAPAGSEDKTPVDSGMDNVTSEEDYKKTANQQIDEDNAKSELEKLKAQIENDPMGKAR